MPAPIAAVGSMMVQGVFKAGGLLTGLGSMVGKLKGAQMEGKSTSTEMKRMTGHAHLLRNALAMIGVGGFSALLMQTPALAGGLAKIKNEMMLMANIVGRALKPSLDAVATILQGIRTGDWSKVKAGVDDLVVSVIELAGKAAGVVIDIVFGEGAASKALGDFETWRDDLIKAWEEGDLVNVIKIGLWDPVKWLYVGAYEWGKKNLGPNIKEAIDGAFDGSNTTIRDTLIDMLPGGKGIRTILEGAPRFLGSDKAQEKYEKEHGIYGREKTPYSWEKKQETSIGNQTNTFNIDMKGITGDIEDPGVLQQIYDAITAALRDEQRSVTV